MKEEVVDEDALSPATVDYFSADEETARHTDEELRLLKVLSDNGVRHLALCAADLNADDLATITGIIQQYRIAEGLPEDPAQPSERGLVHLTGQ